MSCALQSQLNTVPLGASIVRIVQMIVAMAQVDVCGLGVSSSAMYAALRSASWKLGDSYARPRAGTRAPEAAVTGLEQLVALGGDNFARLVFQGICSARRGKWTTYPTPYTSDTPTILKFDLGACAPYTDARLTALVVSLDTGIREFAAMYPCSDTAAVKKMLASGIVSGMAQATCEAHIESAMRALAASMTGSDSPAFQMVYDGAAGHPAINTIRAEIALAFCAGTQGSMSAAGFAEHVAGVLVDGACGIQAALAKGAR